MKNVWRGELLLVPVFHSYGLNLALRGHRYLTLQNEEKSTFWPFKEGNAVDFLKKYNNLMKI